MALVLWRTFYVKFLASNRFVQNVVLVCDAGQVEELILGLENSDPHYRIVAYVDSGSAHTDKKDYPFVQCLEKDDLVEYVNENNLFEIVVASQKKRRHHR